MSVVIQFTAGEEAKALAILLRHSPGSVLPNRIYTVTDSAAQALRKVGVDFVERDVKAL
jgi:hypothetical protein